MHGLDGHIHECINEWMRVPLGMLRVPALWNMFQRCILFFSFSSFFLVLAWRLEFSISSLHAMGERGIWTGDAIGYKRGSEQQAIAFLPYLILDG